MPESITGHFTCDNSYSIWIGDAERVHQKLLEATNTKAAQIFNGEDLPPIDLAPNRYLYICAWSDDAVYQGFIGSFTGALTIHSGDPRWRVLATGVNKNNHEFPTESEINQALSAARKSDWKAPFVGAPNGGPPWNLPVEGIGTAAHWMWHDSEKDERAKHPENPYVPFAGFNHDEFLIFRIPCGEFAGTSSPEKCETKEERCCVMVCQCCHESHDKPPSPVVIQQAPACCGSCVFEVRLQRLRYINGKAGTGDNWAELSFTTHVDGNLCNFPSGNGSYIRIGKRKGDYWPGWMPINVRAGIIEVPCKGERGFDLMTEMVENPQKEKGPAAFLEGGRPWGASQVASPILRCGAKPDPVLQRVRLELGGNSSEDMEVEVEYRFSQVSACSCCGCDCDCEKKDPQ